MHDFGRHYENKTVAITGGNGYLGSALVSALRNTAARILVVSRKDVVSEAGIESLKADIRTQECWREIVQRADITFHLAGNTSVYAAAKDPADSLASTVLPLCHLMAAAREVQRPPRVLYASTATVYGLTDVLPVAEDKPLNPVTTYDLHKLFAEKQLALASNQGIVNGTSLRLANVYGPSPCASSADDRGILNKIARLAVEGVDLRVFGDGDYLRDYVYIDDVVRAFLLAGVHDGIAGQSFNVGSGTGMSVRDAFHLVVAQAASVTGKRGRIHQVPWPDGADPIEFRNYVADVSHLRRACAWSPTVPLGEGIARLIGSLVALKGRACA
jgi:nucleoside-diphosphate-sugar epimerase